MARSFASTSTNRPRYVGSVRGIAAGFLALASLALAPGAYGFECVKAYLPVDFVICSDPETSKANEGHEHAWYETRSRLTEDQKKELLNDQRQWLKTYPPICGVPAQGKRPVNISKESQRCVAKALLDRTEFLRQYAVLPSTQPNAVEASNKSPSAADHIQAGTSPNARTVQGRLLVSSKIDEKTGTLVSIILPRKVSSYSLPCRTYQMEGINVLVEIKNELIDGIPLVRSRDPRDNPYYEPFLNAAIRWVEAVCPRVVFCHDIFSLGSPNGSKEICEPDNKYNVLIRGTFMGAELKPDTDGYGPMPSVPLFVATFDKSPTGSWNISSFDNWGLGAYRDGIRTKMEEERRQQETLRANQAAS